MASSPTSLPRAPAEPSAAHAGAYAGRLQRLLPPTPGWRAAVARLRRKRWMYFMAASDEVLAAAAVVDGGWFAGGFAWAVDRSSGELVLDASAAGLPGLHALVSDGSGPGSRASLSTRALAIHVTRDAGGWILEVETPAGRIEASLDVDGATQPFTFVAPVPGGGLRATEKLAGLGASGVVRLPDRSLSLARGFGGVDVTAGVLARETSWRWAFGSGRVGGVPLGFNLCQGFGVARGDRGENALFVGALPRRLPAVDVQPGLAEWRISSADGAVDLVFRPVAAHRERRDLGLLRTRFAQLAGTFDGRIAAPNGAVHELAALPGVCEDHWAIW